MKTIGIIAEYNPFHNGHAYQIAELKRKTNADFVIIAMSGDFVQRGAPAIIDKYCRAEMALLCGADLVIELPAVWAVSSAEDFAMAGVTLFDKMGCIDGICFGAESDQLPLLKSIAGVLAEEPDIYRSALSSYLKKGLAFPAARAAALSDYFKSTGMNFLISILDTPNNILAVEYLKALKRRNSAMTPILIPRAGSGYHDTTINTPTASASAIRAAVSNVTPSDNHTFHFSSADYGSQSIHSSRPHLSEIASSMPEPAFALFQKEITSGRLMYADDFSSILGYRILSCSKKELENIYDMTPEIANRIIKNRYHFSSFTQFCAQNKSRDITYTRMNRILLHLILQMTQTDVKQYKETDYIPYLRILGFRKDASALLSALKKSAKVPVISKLSSALRTLDGTANQMLKQDIFSSELYEQQKTGKTKNRFSCPECSKEIIRV